MRYFYFDKKYNKRKGHKFCELDSSGLTDGKCMAMRLKGKPPHPDWPVRYPHECPERNSMKCPIRAIDDVENYLINIITVGPPPLLVSGVSAVRPIYDAPYIERHVYVHTPDPTIEDDVHREHPAAWVPPQVFRLEQPNVEINEKLIE